MAKKVATNPYLSVGGTAYTDYIKSMTIFYEREELVTPTSTSTGGQTRIAGLYDWRIEVEFYADLTNSGISEALFSTHFATQVAIIAKLDGATTGATNPKYTGNGIYFQLPLGGEVGKEIMHPLVIKCSDGGVLTRAESD